MSWLNSLTLLEFARQHSMPKVLRYESTRPVKGWLPSRWLFCSQWLLLPMREAGARANTQFIRTPDYQSRLAGWLMRCPVQRWCKCDGDENEGLPRLPRAPVWVMNHIYTCTCDLEDRLPIAGYMCMCHSYQGSASNNSYALVISRHHFYICKVDWIAQCYFTNTCICTYMYMYIHVDVYEALYEDNPWWDLVKWKETTKSLWSLAWLGTLSKVDSFPSLLPPERFFEPLQKVVYIYTCIKEDHFRQCRTPSREGEQLRGSEIAPLIKSLKTWVEVQSTTFVTCTCINHCWSSTTS